MTLERFDESDPAIAFFSNSLYKMEANRDNYIQMIYAAMDNPKWKNEDLITLANLVTDTYVTRYNQDIFKISDLLKGESDFVVSEFRHSVQKIFKELYRYIGGKHLLQGRNKDSETSGHEISISDMIGHVPLATKIEKPFSKREAEDIAKALGIDFSKSKFSLDDFREGLRVELEHGKRDSATNVTEDDPFTTGRIAWAHLKEDPKYYVKLKKIED